MARTARLATLVIMVLVWPGLPSVDAWNDERREFVIGVISVKPDKMLRKYSPMANYIALRLKKFGVQRGTVVVAKNIEEMRKRVRRGGVDLIFESAFSTLELKKEGMLPSLLVWRKGVREYRSLFFVRKDSALQELTDLKGKTIVFEDPHSTSAYAVPKAALKKRGLQVMPLAEARKAAGTVRYAFGGEELNLAFWVIQKKADAGVFNNNDWDELPQNIKTGLRVIHETRPVLRYLGSFHPAVPLKTRQAVENVLVNMHRTGEGRKALRSASRIKKIERLTRQDRKALDYVKELMQFVD
ncbi:MAG TPA: hypothetical protein DCO77_11720 [Nitrospiraceae bacterium]|nr:hypothetical protein [Nitrospiraceae bacterium]